MNEAWLVVMAGGAGARLWPWTGPGRPKPALPIGGAPLIVAAVEACGVPAERVLVVGAAEVLDALRPLLPELPGSAWVVEAVPAGTTGAVRLGVEAARARGAEAVVVVPADQRVRDPGAWREALAEAVASAGDRIVVLGHQADGPDPRFGYILPATDGRVDRFIEKPDREQAAAWIARGALWNVGVFVGRVSTFEEALGAAVEGGGSFDREVVTPWTARGRVGVVRCEAGWADVGTWESALAERLPDARVRGDGQGCVVLAPDREVLLLGVQGLVVLDVGGVLVVADRARVDEIAGWRSGG